MTFLQRRRGVLSRVDVVMLRMVVASAGERLFLEHVPIRLILAEALRVITRCTFRALNERGNLRRHNFF